MIVRFPTNTHEAFQAVLFDDQPIGLRKLVRYSGSANIPLFESTQEKSPDLSFVQKWQVPRKSDDEEDNPRNRIPTAVVEIGVAQTRAKLNFDAARLLMGTNGFIQMVLNIKIQRGVGDKIHHVKWITADMWTLDDVAVREGQSP